jgi:hypothetical protein
VSFMATAMVLAWVAIILLTLSVAGLMRQVHLLLTERAADGSAAPADLGARMLPVDLMAPGAERIVLFASMSCVACSEVMPVMVEYCRGGGTSCTVVTSAQRHPDWPDELVYRENAADLFERFDIAATPHALRIVDATVVASAPVGSIAALRELLHGHRHHADAAS